MSTNDTHKKLTIAKLLLVQVGANTTTQKHTLLSSYDLLLNISLPASKHDLSV